MSAEADKYDVLEKIGHGSFGIIRRVQRKQDGFIMCRKEISYLRMSQKEREQLHAEFQILSHLRHPNIVAYYHREHLKATQDLHLYMEYCGNGDLGRVIKDLAVKNQRAQESFVWSIFSQLVSALYRCHYGCDPPDVGGNVLGLYGGNAQPKPPAGAVTILHRDLKPENVFLGEDNSVKLGDFGLSKMIKSHDFASTYVGTPFYMSPEICAAEKYTLKSDIWSLGCIIYELCAREPPFNAKSHFQLVQKIKEGRINPLPDFYSPELMQVIRDCLRVNPDRRPDTAQLLNLPVVRLMRREKEVVDRDRALRTREEALLRREKELAEKLAGAEGDRACMRQEIDAGLRREWEVRARLEISRHVNVEMEQLQQRFEVEVNARVQTELKQQRAQQRHTGLSSSVDKSSSSSSECPSSSVSNTSDEFSSATDATEISIDSPNPRSSSNGVNGVKKTSVSAHNIPIAAQNTRTPFGRAQTMFVGNAVGTPMDVDMASPSPVAIATLSLSPRRTTATKAPTAATSGNIFAVAAAKEATDSSRWEIPRDGRSASGSSGGDSDDDEPIPSPTRNIRSSKNPFTSNTRPVLRSQKTAPINRIKQLIGSSSSSSSSSSLAVKGLPTVAPTQTANAESTRPATRDRHQSPNRRLSKIPSVASLCNFEPTSATSTTTTMTTIPATATTTGLSRRPSTSSRKDGPETASKVPTVTPTAAKGVVNIRGRTLVELQQARAGGRPLSAVIMTGNENTSPKRATGWRDRGLGGDRRASSGGGLVEGNGNGVAVWDPERDEMPSPFLVRHSRVARV